jgi:hypothetical protein
VIHWVRLDRYSSIDKAYKDGVKRLEVLVSRVQNINPWVTIALFMKILELVTFFTIILFDCLFLAQSLLRALWN